MSQPLIRTSPFSRRFCRFEHRGRRETAALYSPVCRPAAFARRQRRQDSPLLFYGTPSSGHCRSAAAPPCRFEHRGRHRTAALYSPVCRPAAFARRQRRQDSPLPFYGTPSSGHCRSAAALPCRFEHRGRHRTAALYSPVCRPAAFARRQRRQDSPLPFYGTPSSGHCRSAAALPCRFEHRGRRETAALYSPVCRPAAYARRHGQGFPALLSGDGAVIA